MSFSNMKSEGFDHLDLILRAAEQMGEMEKRNPGKNKTYMGGKPQPGWPRQPFDPHAGLSAKAGGAENKQKKSGFLSKWTMKGRGAGDVNGPGKLLHGLHADAAVEEAQSFPGSESEGSSSLTDHKSFGRSSGRDDSATSEENRAGSQSGSSGPANASGLWMYIRPKHGKREGQARGGSSSTTSPSSSPGGPSASDWGKHLDGKGVRPYHQPKSLQLPPSAGGGAGSAPRNPGAGSPASPGISSNFASIRLGSPGSPGSAFAVGKGRAAAAKAPLRWPDTESDEEDTSPSHSETHGSSRKSLSIRVGGSPGSGFGAVRSPGMRSPGRTDTPKRKVGSPYSPGMEHAGGQDSGSGRAAHEGRRATKMKRRKTSPKMSNRAAPEYPLSALEVHHVRTSIVRVEDEGSSAAGGGAGGGGNDWEQNEANAKWTPSRWIQCCECSKWRKIPSSAPFESISAQWNCRWNKWNPGEADCAEDEVPLMGKEEVLTSEEAKSSYEEEKRGFYTHLHEFLRHIHRPIKRNPMLGGKPLDLYRLYREVTARGGCNKVVSVAGTWTKIFRSLENYNSRVTDASYRLKWYYHECLYAYEQFYFFGKRLEEISIPSRRTSSKAAKAKKGKKSKANDKK